MRLLFGACALHQTRDCWQDKKVDRCDRRGWPTSALFWGLSPDFFDLIVIDGCHRGGANDEGDWRDILTYFRPAVQLGLTATPKRRDNVDTYAYFGEPVYTYSLKDGINDGFLMPFKVKQIDKVVEGEVEEGKRYREPQFNRTIKIEERERYRVELFMDQIDQREKTWCSALRRATRRWCARGRSRTDRTSTRSIHSSRRVGRCKTGSQIKMSDEVFASSNVRPQIRDRSKRRR